MERANVLTKLRGDDESPGIPQDTLENSVHSSADVTNDWKFEATDLFPDNFSKNAPENVQKIIIWCLNRSPSKRPLAKTLLSVSCS